MCLDLLKKLLCGWSFVFNVSVCLQYGLCQVMCTRVIAKSALVFIYTCMCLLAKGRVLLARFSGQQAIIRSHTLCVWLLRLRLLILPSFFSLWWTRAVHQLHLHVYLSSDGPSDESDLYFSFCCVSPSYSSSLKPQPILQIHAP